jgi:predicted PurR-regulated permease PerM
VEVRVPFATLLKVALFALIAVAVYKLWSVILMTVIAVLLAVMLHPLVRIMTRHGVRHGLAIGVIAFVIFGLVLLFFFVLVPAMTRQVADLGQELPRVAQQLSASFPSVAPVIRALQSARSSPQLHAFVRRGAFVGLQALEATMALIFTLVLTIYFLVEGEVVLLWLTSFAPPSQRRKWGETASEFGDVILAYMRGQVITCCLCGGWAFLVLSVLRIPASLPLAVLAFFCDLVPVVGTVVMTAPAVLLAMTRGPLDAVLVLAGYIFYHLVESYVIIPRVYGREMRLSTLTVLLAVAVGGTLFGPIGAVLILPFVAGYPIVERIWLRRHLPADTVPRHEALAEK